MSHLGHELTAYLKAEQDLWELDDDSELARERLAQLYTRLSPEERAFLDARERVLNAFADLPPGALDE